MKHLIKRNLYPKFEVRIFKRANSLKAIFFSFLTNRAEWIKKILHTIKIFSRILLTYLSKKIHVLNYFMFTRHRMSNSISIGSLCSPQYVERKYKLIQAGPGPLLMPISTLAGCYFYTDVVNLAPARITYFICLSNIDWKLFINLLA